MEITSAQDYGIRLVLYLSCLLIYKDVSVVNREQISKEMDIPCSFLAKIAQALQKNGIISIVRGKKGGYKLARHPSQISILEVVESIGGTLSFSQCISGNKDCRRIKFCPVNKVWEDVTYMVRNYLSNHDFEKLAKIEFERKGF